MIVSYIKTPIHFDYVRMVQCDQCLSFSEHFLLLTSLHDLVFLDHLYRIVLAVVLFLGHEHLAIRACADEAEELKAFNIDLFLIG